LRPGKEGGEHLNDPLRIKRRDDDSSIDEERPLFLAIDRNTANHVLCKQAYEAKVMTINNSGFPEF
jgi:hypothetical protein